MRFLLAVAFRLLAVAVCYGSNAPEFSDFPAIGELKGRPAVPVPATRFDRMFRTRLLEAAAQGPNFAGHFAIAEWGCGSSCVSIAIVDLVTGAIHRAPFSTLGYGQPYKYEGGDDELEFRVSSRLLIARGCPNDKNCGTYYYEWKGERFSRLRFVPHGPLE